MLGSKRAATSLPRCAKDTIAQSFWQEQPWEGSQVDTLSSGTCLLNLHIQMCKTTHQRLAGDLTEG